MTFEDYLSALEELVAAGKGGEALATAENLEGNMQPPLTPAQRVRVAELLHFAAMASYAERARQGNREVA